MNKQAKFSWRDIVTFLGYFVVTYLTTFLVVLVLMFIKIASAGNLDLEASEIENSVLADTMVWSLFISGLINTIGIFLMYWQFIKDSWMRFWKNWKKNIPIIVVAYVAVFVFEMLFSSFVSSETSANQQSIEDTLSQLSIVEMLIMQIPMVLFAPIVEEFLCRKVLFGSFKDKKLVSIIMFIVSSVFFGLLHYGFDGNFLLLIPYMVMGAVMAGVYWLTDNIFTAIGLHFLNNLIATIFFIITLIIG